jgi:hypothetical protein
MHLRNPLRQGTLAQQWKIWKCFGELNFTVPNRPIDTVFDNAIHAQGILTIRLIFDATQPLKADSVN